MSKSSSTYERASLLITIKQICVFTLLLLPLISHAEMAKYIDNKPVPNVAKIITEDVASSGGLAGINDLSIPLFAYVQKPVMAGRISIKIPQIIPGSDEYANVSSGSAYNAIFRNNERNSVRSDAHPTGGLHDPFKRADLQKKMINYVHEEAGRLQSAKGILIERSKDIRYDVQKEAFNVRVDTSMACANFELRAGRDSTLICIRGSINNENENPFYSLKLPAEQARPFVENYADGFLRLFLECDYKNLTLYSKPEKEFIPRQTREGFVIGECPTTRAILVSQDRSNKNLYQVVSTYEAIPRGIIPGTKPTSLNKVPALKDGPTLKPNAIKQQTIKINQ